MVYTTWLPSVCGSTGLKFLVVASPAFWLSNFVSPSFSETHSSRFFSSGAPALAQTSLLVQQCPNSRKVTVNFANDASISVTGPSLRRSRPKRPFRHCRSFIMLNSPLNSVPLVALEVLRTTFTLTLVRSRDQLAQSTKIPAHRCGSVAKRVVLLAESKEARSTAVAVTLMGAKN